VRHWYADEAFAGPNDRATNEGVAIGDPIPFDRQTGGEFEMVALEAQVVSVPVERLEVGVYMPVVQHVRFENANFRTVTTGTGDVRPHVGWQVTPAGGEAATTLALRAKLPTTRLEVDAEAVPLSEGQVDLAVEQATSWDPHPRLRLTGVTLFRYRAPGRLPDRDDTYKPGDEMVLRASVGASPLETVWVQAGYRGLWSTGWELREGTSAGRSRFRSTQEVRGGIYWKWGALVGGGLHGFALDTSINWPVAGTDYPRGPTWAAAIAWSYE
jgi:hypothetical protein